MKKTIFTIMVLAATCLITDAATLTVSNDPLHGAQYNDMAAAYTAAISGQDTLLVEGTDIPYEQGFGPWNKNLVVIGTGFNPQKQNPRLTVIHCFNGGGGQISGGATGSRFYGIKFTCELTLIATVDSLTFEDCRFNIPFNMNGHAASNYIWKNCIFTENNGLNIRFGNFSSNPNMLVTNCIFNGKLSNDNPTSTLALTVDHCIFLNTDASFNNILNAVIKNSIFMNTATIEMNGSANNTYLNNILNPAGAFPSGIGNNGNMTNTNPNFVTYTGTFYSTSHDYHLQTGSAGQGTATDATDIGVHGGTSNFSENGEVLIVPIVQSAVINNTTVAPNGTLNVQIHARKPHDN